MNQRKPMLDLLLGEPGRSRQLPRRLQKNDEHERAPVRIDDYAPAVTPQSKPPRRAHWKDLQDLTDPKRPFISPPKSHCR
jgi:hypothetical protein